MYFKIAKGTELFEKLVALKQRCNEASDKAQEYGKSLGATRTYTRRSIYIAGGIEGFEFESDKSPDKELWSKPDRHNNPNIFYPRNGKAKKLRANDDIYAALKALPRVSIDEFNEVIGFQHQWINLTHYRSYGLAFTTKEALIKIGTGCNFTPLPDMVEILESEYLKLEKKTKNDNNEN